MVKPMIIKANEDEALDIELEEDFLKAKERIAQLNRKMFDKYGVKVFDFMGSIGSGKTSIIERLVDVLKNKY
ncbi:MAG: hypothetical protein QXW27_03020, partial [Candidatus Methanomethylicaceae archaeon]